MRYAQRALSPVLTIYSASYASLRSVWFSSLFVALILMFLSLYVMLPVWVIPGNDIAFQLSLFSAVEATLLIVLSVLTALLFTMQVFLFARVGKRAFSDGGTGVLSGVGATVVGTASCVGCSIGIALGFLGMGAVLFLIEYQIPIMLGALALFLFALFLIARRINGHCTACEIKV